MTCLQIYQGLLSLETFLQVHWNPKELSYLFWQIKYPNLKTTFHIKLKFFLWKITPCKISHICHYSFKTFPTHPGFRLISILAEQLLNILKTLVFDLPTPNIGNFSAVTLTAAIPVSLTSLLFFLTEHFSADKWKVLFGRHW